MQGKGLIKKKQQVKDKRTIEANILCSNPSLFKCIAEEYAKKFYAAFSFFFFYIVSSDGDT